MKLTATEDTEKKKDRLNNATTVESIAVGILIFLRQIIQQWQGILTPKVNILCAEL
jgi:hypothetical protein